MRHAMTLFAATTTALLSFGAFAAEPPKAAFDAPKAAAEAPKKIDQAELEKKFSETLTGATFDGYYTEGDEKPREAKYVIEKVTKTVGDTWLFTARIEYNGHDVSLPIPLQVLWAGDTPVITLDSVPLPGMGAFSSRVLVHDKQFAGTWSGGDHGGLLFGKITHEASGAKESPAPSR